MRATLVLVLASAALLGGCISDMTYIRADGQRTAADPLLEQQYQRDAAVCAGEAERTRAAAPPITASGVRGAVAAAQVAGDVDDTERTCMALKGYAQVYRNVAEVRREEFAAAEEKRRREAAAAAPAPAPAARAKPRKKPAQAQ
jgi:hypothetical protein